MPRFSVVVPAHDGPGRLPDCLDSVLGQAFADLELIAVVSAPEGLCASIVAAHADRDPRIKVVHSPPGHGLPGARNAGIAVAEGEFLLFLDGDDTLVPGALGVLDARLAECEEPDLLLFDHERVHWFDGSWGATLERLWQGAPAGTFTVEQHPALPDVLVPAWSAAYRRDFVSRRELAFVPGMFTDTVWSVLAALRAERIALLDRICVRHLLRRQGSRNEIPGLHHMDLLDRFDLVMRRAAELKPDAALLGRVFHQLVCGVLKTAASPARLPTPALRRQYFRRAARLYRQHRPTGHRPPGGSVGLQHVLLASRSYTAFRALRGTKRCLGRAARSVGRLLRRLRKRTGNPYGAFLRRPVDENLAVFSSYWGRGYTCNPAAIHAAARRLAPHIRTVFLSTENHARQMPEDVESVVIGSARYWEVMATAKYTFNNVNFEMSVKKRPGTVHVQTQHGTPLKRMGVDQVEFPAAAAAAGPLGKLLQRVDRWDFNLSSNRHSTEVWERAYPGEYESLDVGYPRNDAFYTSTAEDVAAIRHCLGVPEDRIAVLYAPTYRDYRTDFLPQLDLVAFCEALGEEFVVLLRAHHSYEGAAGLEGMLRSGALIDVTEHRSPEEVCLAADVLITDYSSIMFDYANLDRPIVVYADDWDIYRETRGVYFDLLAAPPGPVARTQDELTRIFRGGEWDGEAAARLRGAFRERFCEFDDGLAAERVVRRVLLGEPAEALPPVVPLGERVPAPAAARVPHH
ncbi:bifunctional glycosyltransferase/CDP-glycerol:glycerophosphate glycerophosphotransferase [Streptomyces sp. NBC_01445]|uniref:bifunctional glycosyltransferase/CDP-glycerol:glycerophosphate glycerophosphotransferase n=1 Tax=Streptomyces sp. NBC_01445 TaxID=2903869 RepID=UPI002DD8A05F|nr:bifunctional glycosyltransferase family 2 protein/CDP-glycerol:glycerophosphate glycerophosphotransferase [Streptomyces sp. NBC_01445]WSE04464.1 bifunctional glycosyltransferase family 2 protein/CDP-glycerol:glycerophosphate glycerophosphotransferase [Streptomyces sp. NBC_01445]